jgi:hypothetical protein
MHRRVPWCSVEAVYYATVEWIDWFDDRFRDILLDYHDGPRYPRRQKVGTGDGGLDKLLRPR